MVTMPKKTMSVVGALAIVAGALSFSQVGDAPGSQVAPGAVSAMEARDIPVALQVDHSISIKNLQFDPGTMDMAVGETVTWTNNETDGTAHNINADDGSSFRTPQDVRPGETFSFTPSSGGTFGYHCNIHPQTTGALNVSGGSGEQPPPPPPPPDNPPPEPQPGPLDFLLDLLPAL